MKKSVAIIGGGPAAMMLAAHLNPVKFDTTIYEKNAAFGRKFLVAGQGGFNLTHSESLTEFSIKYIPVSFMKNVLNQFSNTDLRNYLNKIGVPTYIGTSKRVFPEEGIKPVEVLNAFLKQLKDNGIKIATNHTWAGFKKRTNCFLKNTDQ